MDKRITPGTGFEEMKKHIDKTFPKSETLIEMLLKWKNGTTEAFKIGRLRFIRRI